MDYISALAKNITQGQLIVRLPDGRAHKIGHGEPRAEWIIRKPDTFKRIARDPEMMMGETYMEGGWDVPTGGLAALLSLLMVNFPERPRRQQGWFVNLLQALSRRGNRIAMSYRNVAHHYDLDEWLFRRFLDEDMQYSCAYFYTPEISLDEAQRAKCRHIMGKLVLSPGQHVLDIGCGWGGLALYLAQHAGVKVTGLTLSGEQLRVAQQRAQERGLQGLVDFRLQDYREHTGSYDRIVSVGMFEHVGVAHYKCYFDQIKRLLRREGTALLHTIGRFSPPSKTNPWVLKYIFPGGYNPSLSQLSQAIEKSSLITCDIEVLRLHYAMTLAAWLERFQNHRAQIAERMGERFCRMWEFYLASCEAAFRRRNLVVFQVQLAHERSAVPITRDYLYQNIAEQGPQAISELAACPPLR